MFRNWLLLKEKKKKINNVDSMPSSTLSEDRATSSKVRGGKKKEKEKEIAKQDWKELNEFMYGKSSVDA